MILQRRNFLIGLGSLVAAPAVIRVAKLMPISAVPEIIRPTYLLEGVLGGPPLVISPMAGTVLIGDIITGSGLDGYRVVSVWPTL